MNRRGLQLALAAVGAVGAAVFDEVSSDSPQAATATAQTTRNSRCVDRRMAVTLRRNETS